MHAQSGIRPVMYVPVHITYIQTKYQNINNRNIFSGLVQMKNTLLCIGGEVVSEAIYRLKVYYSKQSRVHPVPLNDTHTGLTYLKP